MFGLLGVPAMLFLLHYVLRPLFRRGVPSADAQGPVKLRSQRSITFYSIATGGIIFAVLALITAFFYLDDVSPFALGLCVFAAIAPLYLFIAFGSLLNPRLTVNVFPFPVRAGEEFEVEWEFSGNTARLRKLTVTLEGMKKERLRNSLVQAVCITKTEDALTFAQGKALCAVPVDICPSGEDNVTWNLCFHGAIPTPLWPDVYGKFEVRIAPGRNDA